MGRAFVRVGVRRPAPLDVHARRQAVRQSLAAAAGPLPTYSLDHGSPGELRFLTEARDAGYDEMLSDSWPCEADGLRDDGLLFRNGGEAVYKLGGSYVFCRLGNGWCTVWTSAGSRDTAALAIAAFRSAYPATYLTQTEDTRVPITFWAMGPFGPSPRLRLIDASPWADIERNYTAPVREQLARLMHDFEPDGAGQLLLWQGEPGTGKTWALRALASEWAAWAEFHYITDPDAFFVEQASYMIDVLLADSYATIDEPTGDVYTEADPLGKWRVLILEDTGELLSVNAKEKYGQGLSRLLNVVDGMIGQGLRVLVVVTTNDELGELTPAVKRPGRCASQIEFLPMTPAEVAEWAGEDADEGATLADLYARSRAGKPALDEASDEFDVDEAATRQQIAEVAAAHQPDEPGYGQTAWNPMTGEVLWVSWDGTSVEEQQAAEEAFLAIPGVTGFDATAEGLPDGWFDAQVVYPDDPPLWVTRPADEEAALAETLALATEPLAPAVPARTQAAQRPPALPDVPQAVRQPDTLTPAAFAAIAAAHERTLNAITREGRSG